MVWTKAVDATSIQTAADMNRAYAEALAEYDAAEAARRQRQEKVTDRLRAYEFAGRPLGDTPTGFARWLLQTDA